MYSVALIGACLYFLIKTSSDSVLCYNSVRRLGNSWIGLFSLVLLLNIQVKSSIYYVSPSSDDGWCPDIGMSFTLSEVTTIITDLNVSVILGPGNHSLASNFTVFGLEEFSLIQTESHSPVIIICGVSSKLLFNFATYVHIRGITFSGCLDTEVRAVDKFIIENSTFLARSRVSTLLIQAAFTYNKQKNAFMNALFLMH